MIIRRINKSKHSLPWYSTISAADMDIHANLEEEIVLKPLERKLVNTRFYQEIPEDYEKQIRPRSGLSLNKAVTILNSPGIIDGDYRDEVCVIDINLSIENFVIKYDERVCQTVIEKHDKA
jgi:dUTP pyrophosphatase